LDDVLSAAAAVLHCDGRLIFTLERSDDSSDKDYTLHPHGRYSHRRDYAENALRDAGFEVLSIQQEVLRKEIHQPVHGLLVIARRVKL